MLDDKRYSAAVATAWQVLGLFDWQDADDTPQRLSLVTYAILDVFERRGLFAGQADAKDGQALPGYLHDEGFAGCAAACGPAGMSAIGRRLGAWRRT
jgi:hypothetical protein